MQEIWGLMSAYAERGVAEVNELWVTIAGRGTRSRSQTFRGARPTALERQTGDRIYATPRRVASQAMNRTAPTHKAHRFYPTQFKHDYTSLIPRMGGSRC